MSMKGRMKLKRALSVLLCTIMICTMIPASVSAYVSKNDQGYFVNTFWDLKDLVNEMSGKDEEVYVYWDADRTLVIQESLEIPENVVLKLDRKNVKISEGVTLELNSGKDSFGEIIVDGTLYNRGEVRIGTLLEVNGALKNWSSITFGPDARFEGRENMRIPMWSMYGIQWEKYLTDCDQLKEELAEAEERYTDFYTLFADPEAELVDFHVSEDVKVPYNACVQGGKNLILTIDAGSKLTLEGKVSLDGATLMINGILENNGTVSVGWNRQGADYYYGSVVQGEAGECIGEGGFYVKGGERTDYREFFDGVSLDSYMIFDDIWEGECVWDLYPEPDPEPEETVGGFTDVYFYDYYADPVVWAVENGITNGYGSETTFCPDIECTRGQVVTFLWRAAGSPEPASQNNPFTDVAGNAYYYKAVLWAVENGITAGYGSDTIFNPDGVCNRGQVATFMWRAAGKPSMAGAENKFTDVASGAYYYDAVLWAVQNGITNGYGSDTIFNPDGNCTRGQIVTFLYRGI